MNRLLRILTVSGLLMASHAFAANAFEGKVSLAVTPEKGKPMTMNYSMKGEKLRTDMDANGSQISSIMDIQKMEITMLMPEEKMYMVMPVKQAVEKATAKQGDLDADIERTGKTETILGYKCDQILIKDKEKKTVTELWVATNLGVFMGMGNSGGSPFGGKKNAAAAAKWEEALKGKEGFPLRVISRDAKGKETFKMEATKIEPKSLPDSLFLPPADFQKFQMPDLGSLNPFKRG